MDKATHRRSLRDQVAGALGRAVPDEAWQELERLGFVAELEDESMSVEAVAVVVRRLGSAYRRGPHRVPALGEVTAQVPGGALLERRAEAIAAYAAVAAEGD